MNTQNLKHDSHPTEPANEEIAALAYSFFETTGRLDGHDLEHWLRAEEQLTKGRSPMKKSRNGARTKSTPTNHNPKEKVVSISD